MGGSHETPIQEYDLVTIIQLYLVGTMCLYPYVVMYGYGVGKDICIVVVMWVSDTFIKDYIFTI